MLTFYVLLRPIKKVSVLVTKREKVGGREDGTRKSRERTGRRRRRERDSSWLGGRPKRVSGTDIGGRGSDEREAGLYKKKKVVGRRVLSVGS